MLADIQDRSLTLQLHALGMRRLPAGDRQIDFTLENLTGNDLQVRIGQHAREAFATDISCPRLSNPNSGAEQANRAGKSKAGALPALVEVGLLQAGEIKRANGHDGGLVRRENARSEDFTLER